MQKEFASAEGNFPELDSKINKKNDSTMIDESELFSTLLSGN